jgi:hypothetical protein
MVRDRLEECDEQEDVVTAALTDSIPWLLSVVSHLVLMIVLAVVVSAQSPDSRILELEAGYAEEFDDPLEFHSPLVVEPLEVVEEPVIEPDLFWEDMFEAPHIDLDVNLVAGIGETGISGSWQVQNDDMWEVNPGILGDGDATAGGDGGGGDDTFIPKFDAYWNAASRGFQTMQSCSVDPIDGNVFVAEANLGYSHTVLAVDHYGKGRIAYYCDMTTLKSLVSDFPELLRYLGQRPEPKVLVFGYQHLCQPLDSLPRFKYAGMELPHEYDGNASALATDYDVVIFGAWVSAVWKASWGGTLRDFARIEGGGLLLVGEYCRAGDRRKVKGFQALNSIAGPAKARFNQVSLAWGKAAWGK